MTPIQEIAALEEQRLTATGAAKGKLTRQINRLKQQLDNDEIKQAEEEDLSGLLSKADFEKMTEEKKQAYIKKFGYRFKD